jgi:hypothetical protein
MSRDEAWLARLDEPRVKAAIVYFRMPTLDARLIARERRAGRLGPQQRSFENRIYERCAGRWPARKAALNPDDSI